MASPVLMVLATLANASPVIFATMPGSQPASALSKMLSGCREKNRWQTKEAERMLH